MPFSNPIVGGGGGLVYPSIHSPDYVPGVSGWTINKDGSVEFNSGVFRGTISAGTFEGTDFILNPSGFFLYSGAPALGNLIYSVANTAGVDSFGNAYNGAGPWAYGGSGLPSLGMVSSGINGPGLYLSSGRPMQDDDAAFTSFITNQGLVNEILGAILSGPDFAAPHANNVQVIQYSDALDGSSTAEGSLEFLDVVGTTYDIAVWGIAGLFINTLQRAFAQNPSVHTKPQADTWHTLAPLAAGYNLTGANDYAMYTMGIDGRTTRIYVNCTVTSGPGNAFVQLNTNAIPSDWCPENQKNFVSGWDRLSIVTGSNDAGGLGEFTPTGKIFVYGGATAATRLVIDSDLPLDF